MTEPTSTSPHRSGVSAPAEAHAIARIRAALDRLAAASEAVRLAHETAEDAQQTIREARLAPGDILRNWRASNMLMHAALTSLTGEVRAFEDLMRATLLRTATTAGSAI